MKVRQVKLREIHKSASSAGKPSFCSVVWDQQGFHSVTASSSDASIAVHNALISSCPPKLLRNHRDGVTALAMSPNATCLASGSVDHSVKLYKFPSGDFETNITRFTLPIRALAFNKSGTLLAAAGDDEGIKLINTVDGTISKVLKAHKGPVTGLGFDPQSEYMASIDSTGTVIYWELQSGSILHTLKAVAPNSGLDLSVLNVLSWSPDGRLLAVPGVRNDVVLYDKDTAEKLFTLKGEHTQPICALAWSPNGKYLATSGLDKQVLIWDVDRKQDIGRHKFDERITSLAWKPIDNVLAVIDCMGRYGVWEAVIPSSMKSPTEDVPNQSNNGLLLFDEDEVEGQESSTSGILSDLGEDTYEESKPLSRKRLSKQSDALKELDEDDNDDSSLSPKVESHKKARRHHNESTDNGNEGIRSRLSSARSKMQEAFQPGATPVQPGKRRFLCYNMLGAITTMEYEGYSHIEIDFHDTSRGPRVPSMTDHFGFTMASLNENGCVFANPSKGEKNMSTLMYRPFTSWANNSEWSMRLEGEEVKVVALGTTWVAAVTSLNFIRVFTIGGLQRHVLSLDGPVVTASGFKDELAIVTHASDCLPSNEQVLEFRVLNMTNSSQPLRGRLPLTPGSSLTWFGFSEEGKLSSCDSKGVLRVFTSEYGGSWFPLFSACKDKKPDENYWVVGLNARQLFCIVCKSPDLYPQVVPKPVLTLLNFSIPLTSSDLGAEALENVFILNNMHLVEIQKQIEEMDAGGLDTSSLDDEAFKLETAQDQCILRLIGSCCHGDKLERATELVKHLSLEKSVKGAIKIVTSLKLPNLAERFNSILEERLLTENKPLQTTVPNSNYNASSSTEKSRLSGNDIPLPAPKLSAPMFLKKAKTQEAIVGTEKTQEKQTPAVNDLEQSKTTEKESAAAEVNNAAGDMNKDRPSKPFLKRTNSQDIEKKDEVDKVKAHRPSNPFFKKSVK
ncbi:hypothetical protein ACLB2K_052024 [Fragaria x ananassa]